MDLVTVIIPSYKRIEYLEQCLVSVKAQTYKNIEIIVVDDNLDVATMNKTEAITKKFSNIKYLSYIGNRGGAFARNFGIKHSQGKYIAFLDNDDEFKPDKIRKQVEFLKLNKEFKGVYCKVERYFNNESQGISKTNESGYLLKGILLKKLDLCCGSTLLIEKDIVLNLGGFDEKFSRCQDLQFIGNYLRYHPLGCLDEQLVNINMDDRSNRRNYNNVKESNARFLEYFKEDINNFDEKIQNDIFDIWNFELVIEAIREKNFNDFKVNLKKIKKINIVQILRIIKNFITYLKVSKI